MELGLSKEDIVEEWNKAVQSTTAVGQAAARASLRPGEQAAVIQTGGQPAPLDDLQLAFVSFVNNVVRLNNRRMLEQLEKTGLKLDN